MAYMPEAFGTHHSKMMILLRHDDLAQCVSIIPLMYLAKLMKRTQSGHPHGKHDRRRLGKYVPGRLAISASSTLFRWKWE